MRIKKNNVLIRFMSAVLSILIVSTALPTDVSYAAKKAATASINPKAFNFGSMPAGVKTTFKKSKIIQIGRAKGYSFKLTIDLSKWEEYTSPRQIVMMSKLFWQTYPQMYKRFGTKNNSPRNVILAVENEGYEVAEMYDNFVHIHDTWLFYNPTDYDCLTHEFAHLLQNRWDGTKLEYDDYIERFADYCRFVYAYNDGKYNDEVWELQKVSTEPTRRESVRFLVWLDYYYSTPQKDMIVSYFKVCDGGRYKSKNWKAAWQKIFKGSALEGQSISAVWKKYKKSGFAKTSSVASGKEKSALIRKYNVRKKIKKR